MGDDSELAGGEGGEAEKSARETEFLRKRVVASAS